MKSKFISKLFSLSLLIILILGLYPLDYANGQQSDLPIYIIQTGDTLSTIALRFNISTDDLISTNNIENPNLVGVGDRLLIPGLEGISGILTTQTISLGTTLLSQIRKYQLKNDVLTQLNKYTSPLELFAGQEMLIPIQEGALPLTEISPIQVGMSFLENSIQNNTSPWVIQQLNDISGTWDVLPNEHLFYSETEEVTLPNALIKQVDVNSLPLVQGETVEIILNTTEPAVINASINGKNFTFFSDDGDKYVSLLGISAVTEPGAYQFQLNAISEGGSTYNLNQWIILSEGPYTNDPEIYVDPIYVDPVVISEEELMFDQIISTATSTKYWEGRFQAPIADPTCIVGYFGNRRSYNDGALLYYHTGIDFNVCIEPNLYILAPARGIVVAAEEMTIRGNAIIIDHGWGVYTGYWHLSQFQVEVGDMVEPGQIIGIVGDTGRSAGPHLHFEMIVNGTAVNPLTWLNKTFPSQ